MCILVWSSYYKIHVLCWTRDPPCLFIDFVTFKHVLITYMISPYPYVDSYYTWTCPDEFGHFNICLSKDNKQFNNWSLKNLITDVILFIHVQGATEVVIRDTFFASL